MTQNIMFVPLDKIRKNRFQQDVHDQEKVLEIAESLNENRNNGTKGLLQVPPARALDDGTCELAFGHHRYYAFEYLSSHGDKFFNEMPVNVVSLTDLEMFRYLGIENLKRRDISPIEKGKMFRLFMDTFKKNSVETAKEFSTTDEDVRGSIRFLRLPEETQALIEEGKIGVGMARDLLALGKVAGPDSVLEATNEIVNETWESPADAIQSALSDSDAVFLSASNGWFSAKVFPVKHLKAITDADLTQILLFDYGVKEDEKKKIKSEILTLIASGMEIVDEAFPNIDPTSLEAVRVLVNPPKCEGCPFHAVVRSDHYCGLKACNERKIEAWKKHEIEKIAKELGVPMYQKSDGEYFALTPGEPADRKLWKDGSPDLRLMKASGMWNNFEGLNQELRAVVIGKEAEKRKKKAEKQAQTVSAEDVADAREQAKAEKEAQVRRLKRDFVTRFSWEVVSFAFAGIFDGVVSLPFLQYLTEFTVERYSPDLPDGVEGGEVWEKALKLKKTDSIKEFRRLAIHALVDREFYENYQLKDGDKKPVLKHAENMTDLAEKWEVKLPKDFMKRAEEYQAELDKAIRELK